MNSNIVIGRMGVYCGAAAGPSKEQCELILWSKPSAKRANTAWSHSFLSPLTVSRSTPGQVPFFYRSSTRRQSADTLRASGDLSSIRGGVEGSACSGGSLAIQTSAAVQHRIKRTHASFCDVFMASCCCSGSSFDANTNLYAIGFMETSNMPSIIIL